MTFAADFDDEVEVQPTGVVLVKFAVQGPQSLRPWVVVASTRSLPRFVQQLGRPQPNFVDDVAALVVAVAAVVVAVVRQSFFEDALWSKLG